jgi:hypothetical protein
MKDHRTLIDLAIKHIKAQQSPDGGFESLSSSAPDDFSDALSRRTTFFASNILACLQNFPGPTDGIKSAAATFLLAQKHKGWSFNYWANDAKERATSPYPDDLDDTFSALIALVRHDRNLMDGHMLAAIAKMLTSREVDEGGPYKTWLASDNAGAAWQGVDLVVNSTAGSFLSLIDVHLPRLEDFINGSVRRKILSSPYYPGVFHVGYFLSRFYKQSQREGRSNAERAILADVILAGLTKNNGDPITTLERAMGISAIVNLGYMEKIASITVETLISQVEQEGFLPYAFCIDPARDGKRCYAGASALTAAFCAEALAHYYSEKDGQPHTAPTTHDHIRSLARAFCDDHDIDPALRILSLDQIQRTDDEKITAATYEFGEILYKSGKIIPHDIIESLSLASLYGWMAYAVYDDILDEESNSSLIPCANFFLRSLTGIYFSLESRIPDIRSLFIRTMNRIDGANAWEQKHCRFVQSMDIAMINETLPYYGGHQILADRSAGHAMGPLAELLYAGYLPASAEYKSVEALFYHYLIARQLHDDAHDWADDLLRGRMNSVGTLILRRFSEKYPDITRPSTIADIIPTLREVFWTDVIDHVVNMIIFHIASAREARGKSVILYDSDFIESEIRKLETGARRAIKERESALIFLNDYHAPLLTDAAE